MKSIIANHRTDGEIGEIINHHVSDAIGRSVYEPIDLDNGHGKYRIINHDLYDCSTEDSLAKLLGVYKYSGRVLGTTKPGDILQLHPDLKVHFGWMAEHYRRIGLTYTSDIIWDDDFQLLGQYPEREISVFFFGKRAHTARPNEKWYEITRQMNDKNSFIRLCRRLSLPVPLTECFDTKEEVRDIPEHFFPLYLKLAVSVSGLGVIRCSDQSSLESTLSGIASGIPFQLQTEVPAESFINIQYRINHGRCERLITSGQILDGNAHAGNRYPVKYDPSLLTDRLSAYMQAQGMHGYFAFDLAVSAQGDYYLIECNPRYNGATYPTIIAAKLGIGQWVSRNFGTDKTAYEQLDLGELEYSRTKRRGIVVFNWGCINEGKLGILIAGNRTEQKKIETRLLQML